MQAQAEAAQKEQNSGFRRPIKTIGFRIQASNFCMLSISEIPAQTDFSFPKLYPEVRVVMVETSDCTWQRLSPCVLLSATPVKKVLLLLQGNWKQSQNLFRTLILIASGKDTYICIYRLNFQSLPRDFKKILLESYHKDPALTFRLRSSAVSQDTSPLATIMITYE